ARPEIAVVQRVLELPLAAIPVPIEDEEGDAVLHRPLDLPVHDRRIAFGVVSEQRHALGKGVELPPLLARGPAGEIVGAHPILSGGDGARRRNRRLAVERRPEDGRPAARRRDHEDRHEEGALHPRALYHDIADILEPCTTTTCARTLAAPGMWRRP